MIRIPNKPRVSSKGIQASPEIARWGTEVDAFNDGVFSSLVEVQREIQEFRTMIGGAQQPTTAKQNILFGKGPFTAGNLAKFVDASGKTLADGGAAAASAISGPGVSVVGDVMVWNNTLGTAASDTGIVAANVVVFNSAIGAAVDNAITRFDTTGTSIQSYTSGAPTVGDTGIVAISAGLTLTGAVTNTSTYSVGTNQANFTSTVPATAGVDYGFDFQDTIARATLDNWLGLRDNSGNYRFRVGNITTFGARLIIGDGTANSSTIAKNKWTFLDNVGGTSADPGLTVSGSTATANILTASTANLIIKQGSSIGAGGGALTIQSDGGAAANDNYILFKSNGGFANVAANDWMQWDWTATGGNAQPTDARRMFSALADGTVGYYVYISQGGRWGNNAARVGYAFDGTNWFTWDLMVGGGFAFVNQGAVEPVI